MAKRKAEDQSVIPVDDPNSSDSSVKYKFSMKEKCKETRKKSRAALEKSRSLEDQGNKRSTEDENEITLDAPNSSDSEEEYEISMNEKYRETRSRFRSWTALEKHRLVDSMENIDGIPNQWRQLARDVGDKTTYSVERYVAFLSSLDDGIAYKYFREKFPSGIDGWLQIVQELSKGVNDVSSACIPQVLNVAASEPLSNEGESNEEVPDYVKIYQYLAATLRGTALPELAPLDASVLCELFDRLRSKIANSNLMLQKEVMRDRFSAYEDFTIRGKEIQLIANRPPVNRENLGNGCKTNSGNSSTETSDQIKESKNLGTMNDCEAENSSKNDSIPILVSEDDEDFGLSRATFPSINPFNLPVHMLPFKSKKYVI